MGVWARAVCNCVGAGEACCSAACCTLVPVAVIWVLRGWWEGGPGGVPWGGGAWCGVVVWELHWWCGVVGV